MDKWKKVREMEDGPVRQYIQYFKDHLLEHLSAEKDTSKDAKKNQPYNVIEESSITVGQFSRILDEFNFPLPSFEEFHTYVQEAGSLEAYMQSILDEIIPFVLNEEDTGLNDNLISAINENGEDNYAKILKAAKGGSEEVAINFIWSVLTSYGQRMLDNIEEKSEKTKFQLNYMTPLGMLAGKATLKGIRKERKLTLEELDEGVGELLILVKSCKKNDIQIACLPRITHCLNSARDWIMMEGMPDPTKVAKASAFYQEAVNELLNESEPSAPKEVSSFKQLLRFVFQNEKLLQNADEKLFDRFHELKDAFAKTSQGASVEDVESFSPPSPKG